MSDSRLTLGTAQLDGSYGIANRQGRLEPAEVDAILHTAFELGIRCLDTAAEYGESEHLIGRFLQREGRPDGLTICTKLPRLPAALTPGEVDRAVVEALERSRRRLRTDEIDYYLVHAPANLVEYADVLVDALVRRRDAGWVARIGVSVYTPEEAMALLAHPELTAIQFPFNLFDRRMKASGCLEKLRRGGHITFARSPLLQGLLALAPDALPPPVAAARSWLAELGELCRRHGTAPLPTALVYAATRGGADHLVLGADSTRQLQDAVQVLRRPLPAGLAEELERRFAALPLQIIDPRRWGERAS